MGNDNVTLALEGRVPLPEFSTAVTSFTALLRALSSEIARPAKVAWMLAGLEATVVDAHVTSAMLTSMGAARDGDAVERVVRAYAHVGKALEHGEAIPYANKVGRAATRITGVLNGAITAVRFETPEEDATVHGAQEALRVPNRVTVGAIEGVVQTLSRRMGLRFTLYDVHHDRAVSCYLGEGQDDMMRHAWGNRVIVEGRLTREASTGRALNVRQITAVELVEHRPNAFTRARGALRPPRSMPLPEVLVRRGRDG